MSQVTRFVLAVFSGSFCVLAGCDRTVTADKQGDSTPEPTHASQPPNDLPQQLANRETPKSAEVAAKPIVEQRVLSIQPIQSEDPIRMIQHLGEIDGAIQDLLLTARQMEEQAARNTAIQLSKMKLTAAQHLAKLAAASPEQSMIGMKAQLVALSHLSGLKDVQSARQLEEFAKQLVQHPDADLSHQGQIVLFGFEIQNLQNGILSDASKLIQSAKDLLAEPSFRTRLEMTSISHAINVMHQMGFASEVRELEELTFLAFSESPDRELRYEAWNQWTRQSRSVENFLNSLQTLKNLSGDPLPVLVAARGVYEQHPNPVSLEMIAGVIPDTEYAGHLGLSTDLEKLVSSQLGEHPSSVSIDAIAATLAEHRQRMSWLQRELELTGLVDSDGAKLDLAAYDGKVVLVDFWATWCPPCLQEMPNLKQVYQELSDKGFSILSINMDKDGVRLQQFLKDQRFPWPTYRPANGDTKLLTEQFGITLFPHTMLMNQHRKIVSLHVHGPSLKTQVLDLLQEVP